MMNTPEPNNKKRGPRSINRQKLLTGGLVIAILLACLLIYRMIINHGSNLVSVLNPSLPDIRFRFAIGGEGSQPEYSLSEPMGVDIAGNGDIYVADTADNVIKVFDQNGKFKKTFGSKQLFYLPTDITVKDDRVYVVDGRNSRIQIFDLTGKFVKTLAGPEIGRTIGAWIPSAATVGPNGDIYATDIFYHRVIVFSPDGKVRNRFGHPGNGPGQMMYPNGIAVDRTGNVYVADSNNNRIQVFDPTGRFIGTLNNSQPVTMGMPRGMAFGAKNFLYVMETFTHNLRVLKVNKAVSDDTMTIGQRGVGKGEMNFPNDVAVRNGMLCIADRANDRVLVYSVKE